MSNYLKVALAQMSVSKVWQENLQSTLNYITEAVTGGAKLLVLPEGILSRDISDPDIVLKTAQKLDGEFISQILKFSANPKNAEIAIMFTIHIPVNNNKVENVLVTIKNGEILSAYRKLHLYDAFNSKESTNVNAGSLVPPLVMVAGLKVGLMTCYDVRFPELARRLVLDGADLLVLPAAWVRGPLKEHHWKTLVTARALENTTYLVAVGECGERNIGCSMVVDPLGVAIVQAGESPKLLFADIDTERMAGARKVLPVLANRRFVKPILTEEL